MKLSLPLAGIPVNCGAKFRDKYWNLLLGRLVVAELRPVLFRVALEIALLGRGTLALSPPPLFRLRVHYATQSADKTAIVADWGCETLSPPFILLPIAGTGVSA